MRFLKAIALAVCLFAFYYGLTFLGFAFAGAGHGSAFFAEAVLAPFSVVPELRWLGLGLWPAIGALVALRQIYLCRIFAGILLGFHYLGVVAVSVQTEWSYVGRVLTHLTALVLLFLVGYVGSQVCLWVLTTRRQYAA